MGGELGDEPSDNLGTDLFSLPPRPTLPTHPADPKAASAIVQPPQEGRLSQEENWHREQGGGQQQPLHILLRKGAGVPVMYLSPEVASPPAPAPGTSPGPGKGCWSWQPGRGTC